MKKHLSKTITATQPLTTIHPDAAGIDIGSKDIYVAVPADRDPEFVKQFGTFTSDLYNIMSWLKTCRIRTVAMESTGIYWVPLYEILVENRFEVFLVNPRQLKRPKKTDVLDCQLLQQWDSYGLLKSSFRPADQICVLRSLIRHRSNLTRLRSVHIQHMQKSLHQMNVQLDNVISDITGTTGMQIIRSIVAGNRDSAFLAKFRDPRCKRSEEEIQKSLEGNYRLEHLFTLSQAVELFDFYTEKLKICDEEIEKTYLRMAAVLSETKLPEGVKKPNKDKNAPTYDLQTYLYRSYGVDLTQVPAISTLSAQSVLSEIGPDLSRFPTVKNFTAWLALSPNNKISGGKILDRRALKVRNRAAQALRIAANSLANAKSPMGGYYRKMRAIHGPAKANAICAHKLARIIYFMIKNKAQFDPSLVIKQTQKDKDHRLKKLIKQAKGQGFMLVPIPKAVS
jgi:transposase